MLEKPASVAASPAASAKWDELTRSHKFGAADATSLAMLCRWHAVAEQCAEDMADGAGVRVAYMAESGDIRPMPQVASMKQASAEIRALEKRLGIGCDVRPQENGETVLNVIRFDRARKARAAGA